MQRKFFVICCFFFMGIFALPLQAKISSKIFQSEEKVTAGQLFLHQVDTVCLYLGTERLVYVPQLTKDRHLNVAMNFVDFSPKSNLEPLQGLALRHIETFNKTLRERLDFYTPRLAEEFDVNQDVTFTVNVGVDRKQVAEWKNGNFLWLSAEVPPTPSTIEETSLQEVESKQRCATCPALVKEKKEEVEVAPQETQPKEETSKENSNQKLKKKELEDPSLPRSLRKHVPI